MTRSTCAPFLGASLQALVHAELVGALLDGKDGGAGGDALCQGGGTGGRHWGVVRIVNILRHMPCILVLFRVMQVVDVVQVIVLLFVLVLMHRDLLNSNTTREFSTRCGDWLLRCCCCCCWSPCGCRPCGGCSPGSRPPSCTPCGGGAGSLPRSAGQPLGGCLNGSGLWLVGHHPKPFLPRGSLFPH